MTVKSVKICEAATQMPPASELEQLESVRAQCGSSHLCHGVVNEGRSGMGLQPLPASTALVTFYNEQKSTVYLHKMKPTNPNAHTYVEGSEIKVSITQI